jgi:DNA-binding protein YbaB
MACDTMAASVGWGGRWMDSVGEFDRLLSESRRMLESMRSTPPDGAEAKETVEAADGRIKVVMSQGRLESLELDPRVMRMAAQDLAEQIMTAVNKALDAMAAKASAVDPSLAAIDPQALAAQVAKIQDDGIRQMAAISQEISATVARIRQGMT